MRRRPPWLAPLLAAAFLPGLAGEPSPPAPTPPDRHWLPPVRIGTCKWPIDPVWFGRSGDTLVAMVRYYDESGSQRIFVSTDNGETWSDGIRAEGLTPYAGRIDLADGALLLRNASDPGGRVRIPIEALEEGRVEIEEDPGWPEGDEPFVALNIAGDTRIRVHRIENGPLQGVQRLHVRMSANAGRTWSDPYPLPDWNPAAGTRPFAWADASSGAVILRPEADAPHRIFRSVDGGTTWTDQPLFPEEESGSVDVLDIVPLAGETGILVRFGGDAPSLLRFDETISEVRNRIPFRLPGAPGEDSMIQLAVNNLSRSFFLAPDGPIGYVVNGGWTILRRGNENEQHRWDTALLLTEDGGTTWWSRPLDQRQVIGGGPSPLTLYDPEEDVVHCIYPLRTHPSTVETDLYYRRLERTRLGEEVEATIRAAIAAMGSVDYMERARATETLRQHGAIAAPLLHEAAGGEDPEIAMRAQMLLDELAREAWSLVEPAPAAGE